jgi:hypothetical protein
MQRQTSRGTPNRANSTTFIASSPTQGEIRTGWYPAIDRPASLEAANCAGRKPSIVTTHGRRGRVHGMPGQTSDSLASPAMTQK